MYGKTNLLLLFPKLFHRRPDSMIIAAFDMNDKNTHHHYVDRKYMPLYCTSKDYIYINHFYFQNLHEC